MPRLIFRILDSLPLTGSGKVDRQALAALGEWQAAGTTDWSMRSDGERLVEGIWRALLRHDRFGPDDDFLAAGGDSLLAMHAITQLQRQHGIHIGLRHFLSAPTVAALGARVDDRIRENLRVDEIELARLLDEFEADAPQRPR